MKGHEEDADQIKHLFKGLWSLEDIEKGEEELK